MSAKEKDKKYRENLLMEGISKKLIIKVNWNGYGNKIDPQTSWLCWENLLYINSLEEVAFSSELSWVSNKNTFSWSSKLQNNTYKK